MHRIGVHNALSRNIQNKPEEEILIHHQKLITIKCTLNKSLLTLNLQLQLSQSVVLYPPQTSFNASTLDSLASYSVALDLVNDGPFPSSRG